MPIDPAAFATSNNRGTIVDSGTTFALLVAEAYDPFVSSVSLHNCLLLFVLLESCLRVTIGILMAWANKIE